SGTATDMPCSSESMNWRDYADLRHGAAWRNTARARLEEKPTRSRFQCFGWPALERSVQQAESPNRGEIGEHRDERERPDQQVVQGRRVPGLEPRRGERTEERAAAEVRRSLRPAHPSAGNADVERLGFRLRIADEE